MSDTNGRLDGINLREIIAMSPAAEAIYLLLVTDTAWCIQKLAEAAGLATARTTAAIAELVDLGLAETTPGGVAALPPGPILERFAEQRAREAALAHEAAAVLAPVWSAHAAPASYMEVLVTASAVQDASRRVVDESANELRVLCRRLHGLAGSLPRVASAALEVADHSGPFRVVYDTPPLRKPAVLEIVRRCITAGHQARIFPGTPLDLIIGDRQAVLVVPALAPEQLHGLMIRRSPLYDGLTRVFESFWRMGIPAGPRPESPGQADQPSEEERRLLALLSAGLTEESIARDLDVSERTVTRRIARLQQVLCAESRFQLGVQAVRRGWL